VDTWEARIQESEGKTKSGTQRPTLAKTEPGWGTLKFRYAARSLEPPLGRFCKHWKHLVILQGLEKCHRAAAARIAAFSSLWPFAC
jgi:hypothetical protein